MPTKDGKSPLPVEGSDNKWPIRENLDRELTDMLRGTPPQNILISFDDKPAKSLAYHVKEQQEQAKQKKRRPRNDRER